MHRIVNCTEYSEKHIALYPSNTKYIHFSFTCMLLYVGIYVCSLLSELLYELIPNSTSQRIQNGLDLHILLHHQLHLDKGNDKVSGVSADFW